MNLSGVFLSEAKIRTRLLVSALVATAISLVVHFVCAALDVNSAVDGGYSGVRVVLEFLPFFSGLIVMICVTHFTNRSIIRELMFLTKIIERLSKGDTRVTLSTKAEPGANPVLVQSLIALRDLLVEKDQRAVSGAVLRKEDQLSFDEALKEIKHSEMQTLHFIDVLQAGLRSLQNGNLTHRIEQTFSPDRDQLRQLFNNVSERFQQILLSIKHGGLAIESGINGMFLTSEELVGRVQWQAENLGRASQALSAINKSMLKTTADTEKVNLASSNMKKEVDASGLVVKRTIDAMETIRDSSHKINLIIGAIDDIAFQTNLLALNAGVEAARAGPTGRGFAIVAQEVRALAKRSTDAAKEIKSIVATSQQQVGHGAHLVAEAGVKLNRIILRVGEINSLSADVALETRQHSTKLNEVSVSVDKLDKNWQDNALSMEQLASGFRSIVEQVAHLISSVEQTETHSQKVRPGLGTIARAYRPAKRAPAFVALKHARISTAKLVVGLDDF